jgi:cysteine desulfuration protein SufE
MTLEEIIERFEFLDTWEERYSYLMDLGRKLSTFPEVWRTDENLVEGCVSQVWLVSEVDEGEPDRVIFYGDSDSQIVKGLVSILIMVNSGCRAQEVLNQDISGLFTRLNLGEHLSMNRRNGFLSMVQVMKDQARALLP